MNSKDGSNSIYADINNYTRCLENKLKTIDCITNISPKLIKNIRLYSHLTIVCPDDHDRIIKQKF